ncbi:MAG: nucleoside monophosphate kinase [Puniceicoccales bacterium]|nr:nucleoside monophosphate kinase [Puniceicoccales bacterium]
MALIKVLPQEWVEDCISNIGGYVKMAKMNMDFFREKPYEQFVNDGQLIAPRNVILFFSQVWDRLVKSGVKIISPKKIVWINGAPGSGKGTNARNIMRTLNISLRPIVVSDLLNTDEFKAKIDQGLLVDDLEVTFLVFRRIFEEGAGKNVIVDGYPRTEIQAECVRLLQWQFRDVPLQMVSVVLLVDERTSIQRQLARGQKAVEYNMKVSGNESEMMEVRQTDMDPELAHRRYSEFSEKTYRALKLLKKVTNYHEIDAKGSMVEVRDRISAALKEK